MCGRNLPFSANACRTVSVAAGKFSFSDERDKFWCEHWTVSVALSQFCFIRMNKSCGRHWSESVDVGRIDSNIISGRRDKL